MAGKQGTTVEVRKNPKSTTWYDALIQDVLEDSVVVCFEDNIWPSREVPAASVRRSPKVNANDNFDPQVDDVVEVSVGASESNPSGWALGRVRSIKNSFYFISFEGYRGTQELIVERFALRRLNDEPTIDPADLQRRLLAVDPELHGWMRSQDSSGCLSHVQSKARLLVARTVRGQNDGAKEDPQVLLIGNSRAVELAERLLVEIHFRCQIEIQRFHDLLLKMKDRLKKQQLWYSTQKQEVFSVEQWLVGRLIGKKGENIKRIREKYDVEIRVEDIEDDKWNSSGEDSDRKLCRVSISGSQEDNVKHARDELEFVTVNVPVDPAQVGWILGKGYANIQEIAKKTELQYARFDDKDSSLQLCGLLRQVEDAKLLIAAHSEYQHKYKDIDKEKLSITQSFEELWDGPMGRRRKGEATNRSGKGDQQSGWSDEWGRTGDSWGSSVGAERTWKTGGEGSVGRAKEPYDESYNGHSGYIGGVDSAYGQDGGRSGGKKGGRKAWDEYGNAERDSGYPPVRASKAAARSEGKGKKGKA